MSAVLYCAAVPTLFHGVTFWMRSVRVLLNNPRNGPLKHLFVTHFTAAVAHSDGGCEMSWHCPWCTPAECHRCGPGFVWGPDQVRWPLVDAPTSPLQWVFMTKWEYATVPLMVHATKQILDTWGEDGWELVSVVPGPTGSDQLVAYLKRETA